MSKVRVLVISTDAEKTAVQVWKGRLPPPHAEVDKEIITQWDDTYLEVNPESNSEPDHPERGYVLITGTLFYHDWIKWNHCKVVGEVTPPAQGTITMTVQLNKDGTVTGNWR